MVLTGHDVQAMTCRPHPATTWMCWTHGTGGGAAGEWCWVFSTSTGAWFSWFNMSNACVCVCVCVNSCFKGALSHCCIVQQGGSRVCLFFCWTCFVHVTAPITVQHLEVDKLIDERKDYARHWALPSPSSTLGPGRCNSSGPTDWVTMKPHVGEDMERPYSNKHGSGPLLP